MSMNAPFVVLAKKLIKDKRLGITRLTIPKWFAQKMGDTRDVIVEVYDDHLVVSMAKKEDKEE